MTTCTYTWGVCLDGAPHECGYLRHDGPRHRCCVCDVIEGVVTDAELGARAAKLVEAMLAQCAQYLTKDYGEINDVLVEAQKRGWV
jgi:hypothetical protein